MRYITWCAAAAACVTFVLSAGTAGGAAVGSVSAGTRVSPAAAAIGSQSLTADQCEFFAVDSKVTICHKTGSSRNPYVLLRLAVEACMAHADHERDYVPASDTCDGF